MLFRGQSQNFPFREEGSKALGMSLLFWTTLISGEYNFQHPGKNTMTTSELEQIRTRITPTQSEKKFSSLNKFI